MDQVEPEVAHEELLAEARQLPVRLARVLGDLACFLLADLDRCHFPLLASMIRWPPKVRLAAMRLTILGKSPAWSDAGGACSGYLVEEGETKVVVDCGNGVFGKLRERVDYARRGRGRDHPPPRRPRARPRPLLLRAQVRAGGPRSLRASAADRADRRGGVLPPPRRDVERRGPDRRLLRARGVRARLGGDDRLAHRSHPRGAPHRPHARDRADRARRRPDRVRLRRALLGGADRGRARRRPAARRGDAPRSGPRRRTCT